MQRTGITECLEIAGRCVGPGDEWSCGEGVFIGLGCVECVRRVSRVFKKASLGTDRVMLVDNNFYDIVRIKDVGYILMKTPDELPNYQP